MQRVDNADWDKDNTVIRHIRYVVFVEEQQVPLELDFDGRDRVCKHVLAFDEHGVAVGTGRIQDDGKIGRMAVLEAHRGQGVGGTMLEHLIALAREAGLTEVFLDAQAIAEPFYTKAGFTAEGDVFVDVGVEHRRMRRAV